MRSPEELVGAWQRELPDLDLRALPALLEASRLASVVDAFQAQILEPFEIGRGEYAVLGALRSAGPPYRASPGTLQRLVGGSSAGMAKRLRKLEEAGLVLRSPDPEDGRSALVTLSRRGLDLQERIFKAHLAAMGSRLETVDATELREILDSLSRLASLLEA